MHVWVSDQELLIIACFETCLNRSQGVGMVFMEIVKSRPSLHHRCRRSIYRFTPIGGEQLLHIIPRRMVQLCMLWNLYVLYYQKHWCRLRNILEIYIYFMHDIFSSICIALSFTIDFCCVKNKRFVYRDLLVRQN